ncbi:MAG: DUF721 domain-containing protein [Nitrospirota bacterium]
MQSLKGILRQFAKDFGIEGTVALKTIKNQWAGIVGQPIAVHTFPDTIKSKILTVIVDTPQWMHHLGFFKGELLQKLDGFDISEIRFRIGRLPETEKAIQEEMESDLTEDELRYIENTVKNLKDEELKEKFRKLITHGLTKGKKGD